MATIEETKEYLNQVRMARQKLIQADAQLAEMRTTSNGLTTSYSIGGRSNHINDLSDYMAIFIEEELKLEKEKQYWLEKRIEIKNFINSLKIPKQLEHLRTILILKYVSMKTFGYIADSIGYDEKHVVKVLHPKALEIAARAL